jgi:signal transduction histidine kinase
MNQNDDQSNQDKLIYQRDDDNLIGLGLFISLQIVNTYKGQLDFVSEDKGPQKGSTFIFSFDLEINHE